MPSCYKDASKLYYGGKKLIYYDDSLPETSIESVFRNYTYYTRKKYKDNHYKEHIRGFSKKTGIALTEKGLLDVIVFIKYFVPVSTGIRLVATPNNS